MTTQLARRRKIIHNISPTISWRSTFDSSSRSGRSRMTRCTHRESSTNGWISCSMRSRMLLHAPNARLAFSDSPQCTQYIDNQAQLWFDVSRFHFFVFFSCRVVGPAYHDRKINELAVFSYYVYVVSVMAALSIANLSRRL